MLREVSHLYMYGVQKLRINVEYKFAGSVDINYGM
jgi:hypothetical protein